MSTEAQQIEQLLLDIKRRVERLEDLEDIKGLIVSYARACDRGNDPDLLMPLFAEDSRWECNGFGAYSGRRTVAAALKAIAGEKIWWSLHYMISPLIEIDTTNNTATAFWYLWESATVPNADTGQAESHWIGGTYDSILTKVDGKWLFRKLVLSLNIASPYSEGWVKRRFPKGSNSQPYFCDLEPGNYFWCACGLSQKQPFCDGSHKRTNFRPVEFTVERKQVVVLCGCKRTCDKPRCDGTHLNLDLFPVQEG
jgi:CDGSH-type Zn-finger protein